MAIARTIVRQISLNSWISGLYFESLAALHPLHGTPDFQDRQWTFQTVQIKTMRHLFTFYGSMPIK